MSCIAASMLGLVSITGGKKVTPGKKWHLGGSLHTNSNFYISKKQTTTHNNPTLILFIYDYDIHT